VKGGLKMFSYILLGIFITATLFVIAMVTRAGQVDRVMGYK